MTDKELTHYGIKGMHWGVRRFQNPDGTLTEAGKKRYTREERTQARNELKSEKDKLSKLQKEKFNIESDAEYRDDVYSLRLDAEDMWDYEKNDMLSDKEIDANWDKFTKAYNKALSDNPRYAEVIKEIENSKSKISDLETIANVTSGEKALAYILEAASTLAATAFILSVFDHL